MSWLIVIFDFNNSLPPLSKLDEPGFKPPIMGSLKDIKEKITAVWPRINWDTNKIYYEGSNCVFKIEFSTEAQPSDNSLVDCIMLWPGYDKRLNPYPALENLCLSYQWSALDTEINNFLLFPQPNMAGLKLVRYKAAQYLRNIRRLRQEGKLPVKRYQP
jgi:hypothetical protein